MPDLIVLTCASGKQCSQFVPLLTQQSSKYELRLIVKSEQSLHRLQEQWLKADVQQERLDNPEDCSRILKSATTLYYVSPTFQPKETQFGINIIDAAVAEASATTSGFKHFIFSSVLHPEISKLLNHDRKRYIEEYLTESSLPYTIPQPSHFAENAMPRLRALKDSSHPVFMAAHNPGIVLVSA